MELAMEWGASRDGHRGAAGPVVLAAFEDEKNFICFVATAEAMVWSTILFDPLDLVLVDLHFRAGSIRKLVKAGFLVELGFIFGVDHRTIGQHDGIGACAAVQKERNYHGRYRKKTMLSGSSWGGSVHNALGWVWCTFRACLPCRSCSSGNPPGY